MTTGREVWEPIKKMSMRKQNERAEKRYIFKRIDLNILKETRWTTPAKHFFGLLCFTFLLLLKIKQFLNVFSICDLKFQVLWFEHKVSTQVCVFEYYVLRGSWYVKAEDHLGRMTWLVMYVTRDEHKGLGQGLASCQALWSQVHVT